jgi:glycerophosphoryl diester phosphodiesterase
MNKNNPLIIAHRGASGYAPENTLSAFKLAAKINVDFIEIDVHQSADGIIVCNHDEDLSRTTTIKGRIRDLSYSELLKADAGIKFSNEFKGELIPTLEQALSIGVPFLIEVKKGDSYYPGIIPRILKILNNSSIGKKCIIQSFDTGVLKEFFDLDPSFEYHKLVTGNIPLLPLHIDHKLKAGKITKYKSFDAINPHYKFLNKRLIGKIHNEGQKVFTWTVNEEADMKRMIELGVDGIITDFPDKLLKLL